MLACVVLFDIDGTLVAPRSMPSPGLRAMSFAAQVVSGVADLHQRVEFAGRTDREIAQDLLRAATGEPPSQRGVHRLLREYLRSLGRYAREQPYRAIEGVREAVEALRAVGATVGLGTGNLRRGAGIKLKSAGLADLFDLRLGGYGNDAATRDGVLRVGALRCDATGRLPVVIVGDTPHDIRAAHAIGAPCIAVSTGHYDIDSLSKHQAEIVVRGIDATVVEHVTELVASLQQSLEHREASSPL